MGAMLGKKYGIPHIWHVREHGEVDFKLISVLPDPVRYMNGFDSTLVMISGSVRNIWAQRGLDTKKMRVIYDGVRTELYHGNAKTKREAPTLKAVFLGGYTKNKGQEELLEALNLLGREFRARLKVDLFGNNEGNGAKNYRKYLQKKAREYDLEEVVSLHGYVEAIWDRMDAYDIGLTCSNAEGFGRVTVEYMLAGLCPIVSDTGANTELVENGVTGLAYEKGNIEALKNALCFAIQNKEQIYELGQNAAAAAKNRYSMKKHAEQIWDLYGELLQGGVNG
jgi:glycosyltransferase involved in cell wall biosynthesis